MNTDHITDAYGEMRASVSAIEIEIEIEIEKQATFTASFFPLISAKGRCFSRAAPAVNH